MTHPYNAELMADLADALTVLSMYAAGEEDPFLAIECMRRLGARFGWPEKPLPFTTEISALRTSKGKEKQNGR